MIYRYSRGFSLIEAVIGAGLMCILLLTAASLVQSQTESQKFVANKTVAVSYQQQMGMVFQEAANCSCQLNPDLTVDNSNDAALQWDPTVVDGTASMNLHKLHVGCTATSPILIQEGQTLGRGLTVTRVEFTNLKPLGVAGGWTGSFKVSLVSAQGIALNPIQWNQSVTTQTVAGRQQVIFCKGAGSGGGGSVQSCPAGTAMVGPANGVGTYCIETVPRAPLNLFNAILACGSTTPAGFGPGQICPENQYYTACRDGLITTVAGGQMEWFPNIDSQYAVTARPSAAGDCDGIGNSAISNTLGFRCCWK